MMRSLWTAASGMKAQQMSIDVISNNLSNVTTTGYKAKRIEFKDLFYQNVEKTRGDRNTEHNRPVALQVGHGVRPAATVKDNSNGSLEFTENKLDFALEGNGFFKVKRFSENTDNAYGYTRDGSFKLSIGEDGNKFITTSSGYPVMDENDSLIEISGDLNISDLMVDRDGDLYYLNEDNEKTSLDKRFKIVQFDNVDGLENMGDNLIKSTLVSGEEKTENDMIASKRSKLMQGYLERSNVQIVKEMVNLITAQRAYEINSKSIQTSDEMLSQANQLKR